MGQMARALSGQPTPLEPVATPHPAERLDSWLRRSGLDISMRNPETGRHELVLVAPDGFDAAAAQRSLATAMAPPNKGQLAKWIATLAAITISRQRDELDQGLIMAIYAERLSAFPADVVEHVCLRERWKFFPAIAELEDRCEELSARRRTVARLLAEGRVRCGEQPRQPERGEPLSAEARRRIMAEVWPDRVLGEALGPVQRAVQAACDGDHDARGDDSGPEPNRCTRDADD